MPSSEEYKIKSGVIFCLQQKGDTSGNETINPLQPYFLVYIRNSKDVRYTFAQPKQILDIYRLLCNNQNQVYQELCHLFNQETQNGYDMKFYNHLLDNAFNSITKTFQKRSYKELQNSRSAKLINKNKQVKSTQDFDLITWLVIKDEEVVM